MCIGAPVQVIESHGFTARCRGRNGEEEINMMLVGPQPEGTWLVNFLGSARDVLTEEEARRINEAMDELAALVAASGG
ncbi:HypC/HybG/HupF family hydrogenase formation chaperone [Endothiovibrio diazotrophicus]